MVYILEVELAEHSLHRHIIPQITKFNIAYQQSEIRRKLTEALYTLIQHDPYKTAAVQAQKIQDTYKYLTETIHIPPTIAIIIDQKTPELDAVCKNLPFKTRTTEFKTYVREKVGINVQIHMFEPLYEKPPIPKGLIKILKVLEQVYKGKTYDEAVKITAKKLKLFQGTIRGACTKDIGITAKQFRKLIKDKKQLKTLLIEKYPDHEDNINQTLS